MMEAWKGLPFPAAMSTQDAGIKNLYFKQSDGNPQWIAWPEPCGMESCQNPLPGS